MVVTEYFTYLPGDTNRPTLDLTITEGASLTLVNVDPFGPHTVTSDDIAPGQPPPFDSAAVNAGGVAGVVGVDELAPGAYPFHCEIHSDVMRGILHVRVSSAVAASK